MPGDDWQNGIRQAMIDSEIFLLVASPKSVASRHCANEWTFYREFLERTLLYVTLLETIKPQAYPMELCRIQWADVRGDKLDAGTQTLINAMQGKRQIIKTDASAIKARRISGEWTHYLRQFTQVGRDADWNTLHTKLDKPLPLFITGYGGLGKSRMAAELAFESDLFPDGAVWHVVKADPTMSAARLLEHLAEHCGLPERTPTDAIMRSISAKKALIVIDNAESADAKKAQDYQDLLVKIDPRNGTRIVFTSREQWDLYTNTQAHTHTLGTLNPPAAEQLIRQMLETAAPQRMPTADEIPQLAAAAKYHPRLMEFAINFLRAKSPKRVLAELNELKGRQVERAIDDLITRSLAQMEDGADGDLARTTLNQLAAFGGPFTEDLMEDVIGIDFDGVEPLTRWTFLRYDAAADRYWVPPLVREVIVTKLKTLDHAAAKKHFAHFFNFAVENDARTDVNKFIDMETERANLDAAFAWGIVHDPVGAMWLSNACADYFSNRGRFRQRLDWSLQVVAALHEAKDIANAQNSLGNAYRRHGADRIAKRASAQGD